MELIISTLLGFALVMTRVLAFFLVSPVFSGQAIPARIKISIVMIISIFLSAVAPFRIDPDHTSPLQAALLISNEVIYGFALGLIVFLLFSAVKQCGEIIEYQMGLSMAEMLDPMTGESAQPLSGFLGMIFLLIFLSINGHHFLLSIISRSYEAFPVGVTPTLPILLTGIAKAGSVMFVASLKLAAPILAAFLILLSTLAVFARIIPDMDILFISMPLSLGLGLFITGIFLPFINQFVLEFIDWTGKLLPL